MRRKILLLGCLVAVLSGCLNLEEEFTIKEDGSGSYKSHLWMAEEMIKNNKRLDELSKDEIQKKLESARIKISELKEETKSGERHLYVSFTFEDINKLREIELFAKRNLSFTEEDKNFTFKCRLEGWKPDDKPVDENLKKRILSGLRPYKYKLTVNFPDKVLKSDAQTREDKVAKWEYSLADFMEQKEITFTAEVRKRPFILPYILIVGGVILLVVILIVYFISRGKNSPS